MGYSIRDERYRYTEWRDWQTGRVVARELYDHESDPGENRNVAEANSVLVGAKTLELQKRFGLNSGR
jgi:iduronate 2-sulfatase